MTVTEFLATNPPRAEIEGALRWPVDMSAADRAALQRALELAK